MLPWLFLEPDALCYLPVRPTNSGCCLCVLLDVWAGLFMFIWAHQKVRKHFFIFFFKTLNFFQAPSSLLEALEQHLASLEGKKIKELNADTRWTSLFPAYYQVFLEMYDHAQLKVRE